jgi:hypothetical protein
VPKLHAIKGYRGTKYKIKYKWFIAHEELHQINLNFNGQGYNTIKFKLNMMYTTMLFIKYELTLQ